MREIKFKVWNKATKTMHYPDWDELAKRAKLAEMVFLQYIGLKDRSGKKFYHKDYVKDEYRNIWLIDWSDEYAGFELTLIHSEIGEFTKLNICRVIDMEYIGSYYENPELMEK